MEQFKMPSWIKWTGIVVATLAGLSAIGGATETPEQKKTKEQQKIESTFLYSCERQLKQQLNNPDSYKRIDWASETRSNGGIQAIIKYQTKNSFGTYVTNKYVCTSK